MNLKHVIRLPLFIEDGVLLPVGRRLLGPGKQIMLRPLFHGVGGAMYQRVNLAGCRLSVGCLSGIEQHRPADAVMAENQNG